MVIPAPLFVPRTLGPFDHSGLSDRDYYKMQHFSILFICKPIFLRRRVCVGEILFTGKHSGL